MHLGGHETHMPKGMGDGELKGPRPQGARFAQMLAATARRFFLSSVSWSERLIEVRSSEVVRLKSVRGEELFRNRPCRAGGFRDRQRCLRPQKERSIETGLIHHVHLRRALLQQTMEAAVSVCYLPSHAPS